MQQSTFSGTGFLRRLILGVCVSGIGAASAFDLEMGAITLNDTFTNATWTNVTFVQPFPTAPVVVSLPTNQGGDPANVRIRNVTATGFEILQTEPNGNDGPHVAMNTAYLAVEPGTHTLPDGSQIIAFRHTTSQTIAGSGGGFDTLSLVPGFPSPPAIVTGLQTTRNETGNPPSTSSIPHIGVAVRNVTASSLQLSIERAESTSGSVTQSEDIAVIAIDSAVNVNFLDSLGTSINFQALVTPNNIEGWDNGCFTNSFTSTFGTSPVVVASMNTRAGGNGGWLRRCSLSSTSIGLTVDEDIDSDSERSHIAETAGVVAASNTFHATLGVNLRITKTSLTVFDDHNGAVNPKAIPNARVQYAITTENFGSNSPDNDSLIITDTLAPETALCVTTACNPGGPIVFDDAASPIPVGVTLNPSNVSYSNNGGTSYTYVPTPDAEGFDPAVNAIRVQLTGIMASRTLAGTPEFTLRLISRVN